MSTETHPQGSIVPLARAPRPIDPGRHDRPRPPAHRRHRPRARLLRRRPRLRRRDWRRATSPAGARPATSCSWPPAATTTTSASTRGSRPAAGRSPTASPACTTSRSAIRRRAGLADALRRLREVDWPIRQATDHGTHEAIYISDPDGNDLELCWDRAVRRVAARSDGHYGAPQFADLDLDRAGDERVAGPTPWRRSRSSGARRRTSRRSSRCGSPSTTRTPRRCPSSAPYVSDAQTWEQERDIYAYAAGQARHACCCSRTSAVRSSATRSGTSRRCGDMDLRHLADRGPDRRGRVDRRAARAPRRGDRQRAARRARPRVRGARRRRRDPRRPARQHRRACACTSAAASGRPGCTCRASRAGAVSATASWRSTSAPAGRRWRWSARDGDVLGARVRARRRAAPAPGGGAEQRPADWWSRDHAGGAAPARRAAGGATCARWRSPASGRARWRSATTASRSATP